MTTTTMKERMARGQAEFDGRQWLHMHRADRKRYIQRVELFLDALYEPSEGMIEKTGGVRGWGNLPVSFDHWLPEHLEWWQAMIDHIRSEDKT